MEDYFHGRLLLRKIVGWRRLVNAWGRDLRADAARLAANPEYQAEIRAVREELDELRAW
jgi:hypothetical protein